MTYLSDELYETVTNNIPVVCVDIIPVRKAAGAWQIGVITRATGAEAGKLAILGGRIWHNETIRGAMDRHAKEGWGTANYTLLVGNTENEPFFVQQYLHQASAPPLLGFDPSKHALALTYLVELAEAPQAQGEAIDFLWVSKDRLPANIGYNQETVMQAAFKFLEKVT